MNDILPFPNTTGTTSEEKISNISNYLIQLKEELEFILTNITTDNLSPFLIDKLNSLGSNLEKSTEEADDKISQVAGKKGLTLYDVFNSDTFKELKEDVEEQNKNKIDYLNISSATQLTLTNKKCTLTEDGWYRLYWSANSGYCSYIVNGVTVGYFGYAGSMILPLKAGSVISFECESGEPKVSKLG